MISTAKPKPNAGGSTRPPSILDDVRGLSTVEYVILLVLIAASAIGTWVIFGDNLVSKLKDANTQFDRVTVGAQSDSQ